ncbi:MAG: DUF294 nucleotidyltransferase-like domain-containing protein [Pseudomonadota bacterium]
MTDRPTLPNATRDKRSDADRFRAFAARHHPFDTLPEAALAALGRHVSVTHVAAGETLFGIGYPIDRFRMIRRGQIDLVSPQGEPVQSLRQGDGCGARALLRGTGAALRAEVVEPAEIFEIEGEAFKALAHAHPVVEAFFERPRRAPTSATSGLTATPLRDLMTARPLTIPETASIAEAARAMAERKVSCVLVTAGETLAGMVTTGDMTRRVVAAGTPSDAPVSTIMTANPFSLGPDDTGFDAMLAMSERGIGHLPITEDGRPVGILTRTDLMRSQQVSAVYLIRDIARRSEPDDLATVVDKVPDLVAQLVASSAAPREIGHVVTTITDALTRRLVSLAEARLGPPPVPYLWLACGSQGRCEQTAVSDQDNCIILDDAYDEAAHGAYFTALAAQVCDGLNTAGYVYCPGDMMASNPRWRQPVSVWRDYFAGWIAKPDPMAQMLASVMFDLRPIAGTPALFEGLQAETLRLAGANSIFRAHMVANSLKHTPPLGVFRGFALIRSGEHEGTIDMKHSGVVPIVDLARVYALEGGIEVANTRDRLIAAREAGTVSRSGGGDLIDAFDLICELRLEHQARQIRDGEAPDNYLAPATLSALERNHLRDAFGVVKTMQSALGHGRAAF